MRGGAKDGLGLVRDAGFGFFASVHATIRGDAKRFRILRIIGKDGDPYAGTDLYVMSAHFHGPIEQRSERLSNASGIGASHGVFEDDGELVAAGSRNGVGAAHTARKRTPTCFSSWSPMWCPTVSLTNLNSSRSTSMSATWEPSAASPDQRTVQSVLEEAAIGQAGSSSCNARYLFSSIWFSRSKRIMPTATTYFGRFHTSLSR